MLKSFSLKRRWWKRNRGKEEKLVKARGRTWGHTLTGRKIVMGKEETQA